MSLTGAADATGTRQDPGRRSSARRRLVAGAVGGMALVALVAAPGAASTLLGTASTNVPIPATDQSTPQPTLPADSPDVLIIGDSTTVHMLAEFREALAARGLDATIDARSGRTTREGRAVLAAYDVESFDYVAVLLGANGLRANALRDMQALRAAGVDTMATVQAPQRRIVNRAVRRVFGADRIRWAGYADSRAIETTDAKHYTPQAYRVRARYLAGEIAERVS